MTVRSGLEQKRPALSGTRMAPLPPLRRRMVYWIDVYEEYLKTRMATLWFLQRKDLCNGTMGDSVHTFPTILSLIITSRGRKGWEDCRFMMLRDCTGSRMGNTELFLYKM